MQYELVEINGKKTLIDTDELSFVERFQDAIVDVPSIREESFQVCYGCYIPQPDSGLDDILSDLDGLKKSFVGVVIDDKCHRVDFLDVDVSEYGIDNYAMPMFRIPFSALIQADEPVLSGILKTRYRKSVTGFVRYGGMSPASNIFNRSGIVSIRGIEQRTNGKPVNKENWRLLVDRNRAVQLVRKVR